MTSKRNSLCHCGSGKKFKKCCMKNRAKGGSPCEKRPMMLRSEPKPVVPVQALPQMAGLAAMAMMQRMRQERPEVR